jgi:hypothetical protein
MLFSSPYHSVLIKMNFDDTTIKDEAGTTGDAAPMTDAIGEEDPNDTFAATIDNTAFLSLVREDAITDKEETPRYRMSLSIQATPTAEATLYKLGGLDAAKESQNIASLLKRTGCLTFARPARSGTAIRMRQIGAPSQAELEEQVRSKIETYNSLGGKDTGFMLRYVDQAIRDKLESFEVRDVSVDKVIEAARDQYQGM